MSFDFSIDPFENLDLQLGLAKATQAIAEPTAMSLSTASKNGLPSVRTVLFKGLVRGGLSFYTNYNSLKSRQLTENPRASLLFCWGLLSQQINLSGVVDRVSRAESEKYFSSRHRLSQIGAWASEQDTEIDSLDVLDQRAVQFEKQFAGADVPCPPHWGGFRFVPLEFEFWFGKDGRMHQRYVYQRTSESTEWRRFLRSP